MRAKLIGSVAVRAFASTPGALDDDDPMIRRAADSASMLPYWEKADDFAEGGDCVTKNSAYMPHFPDEEADVYSTRQDLALLTNIYSDIIESLSSKPFEEETQLIDEESAPDPMVEISKDLDGEGSNLTMFGQPVFFHGINSAVHWIFVDFPKTDASVVRTMADEKAMKVRPFWSNVLGRNVLECRWARIGGETVLVFLRILEPGPPDRVRIFARDALETSFLLYESVKIRRRRCKANG